MGKHRDVVPYVDATPRAWDRGTPAHREPASSPATEIPTGDITQLVRQAKRSVQLLSADRDPAAFQVRSALRDLLGEQALRKRARA